MESDVDTASAEDGLPETEAGSDQAPYTAGDALLAQQLAAEMEKGAYAKVSRDHPGRHQF